MKLIIDIPEEEWLFTKAKIVSEDDSYVDRAVANGIPLEQIENDIRHEIADIDESDFRRGVNIGLCHAIQHVRKYR